MKGHKKGGGVVARMSLSLPSLFLPHPLPFLSFTLAPLSLLGRFFCRANSPQLLVLRMN